jgi:hypothetical protein
MDTELLDVKPFKNICLVFFSLLPTFIPAGALLIVERVYKRLDLGRERGGRKKNIAAYS